jgi:hypothetical protein
MNEITPGIRQVENLEVSFDQPGAGAYRASAEPPPGRRVTRAMLALAAAAAVVVAGDGIEHGDHTRTAARVIRAMAHADKSGPVDGDFHRTVSYAELRSQGLSIADGRSNAGAYALTLHRGRFRLHAVSRDGIADLEGRYEVRSTRLTLTPEPDGTPIIVTWLRQGPNLILTSGDRSTPPGWIGSPWIPDAAARIHCRYATPRRGKSCKK